MILQIISNKKVILLKVNVLMLDRKWLILNSHGKLFFVNKWYPFSFKIMYIQFYLHDVQVVYLQDEISFNKMLSLYFFLSKIEVYFKHLKQIHFYFARLYLNETQRRPAFHTTYIAL